MTEVPKSVMIIDDKPANLEVLNGMLSARGYDVRMFLAGRDALRSAVRKPPGLVLLDISMPDMDGFEVARAFRRTEGVSKTPILFISARTSTDDKLQAFRAGGLDYITKPFQVDEVLARVSTHLELRRLQFQTDRYASQLEQMVNDKVREISRSQIATIRGIAKLAEKRDDETGQHVERTRTYAAVLARDLLRGGATELIPGEDWVETIYEAAALHDIGKVGIADSLLRKPGRLTDAEFETMKTHVTIGAETLVPIVRDYPTNEFLRMGMEIARCHHERWDGSGYASGLRGEDIPLSARIMAVADVYDALRSERPYKDPFPHAKSGRHFDPMVVEAFSGAREVFREISEESSLAPGGYRNT